MRKLIEFWSDQDEKYFNHLITYTVFQFSCLNIPPLEDIKAKLEEADAPDKCELVMGELVIKFDASSIRFFDKGMFDFDLRIEKAYKAFNTEMYIKSQHEYHDFQFEEGKIYEIHQKPIWSGRGFRFHPDIAYAMLSMPHIRKEPVTHNSEPLPPRNLDNTILAEVEILGDVSRGGWCWFATNKLKVVNVLSKEQAKYILHGGGKYNNEWR